MQKGLKEDLLKILKDHEDLHKSAPKTDRNDLKDFRSDLKPLRNLLKSFEDALEREIESRILSKDFNEDQFEAEQI